MVPRGEQGLLGLTFHPQYRTNGRFFVNYTRVPDGATVVAEYRVSSDPTLASPAERRILVVPQPHDAHNGGMIEFGPDETMAGASWRGAFATSRRPAVAVTASSRPWRSTRCRPSATCRDPGRTAPPSSIFHHPQRGGVRCAVIGGYVYRGSAIPGLVGT